MSKFDKYEKNHKDILQNPSFYQSMDKAKRKHRRKKAIIAQSFLMVFGLASLGFGIILPCIISYQRTIPYAIYVSSLFAHVVFYILLKSANKETQDGYRLLMYGKSTKSYKPIPYSILKTKHLYWSRLYTILAWLGPLISSIKYVELSNPITRFESVFALLVLLTLVTMCYINLYKANEVDIKCKILMKGD